LLGSPGDNVFVAIALMSLFFGVGYGPEVAP
jgi:hypothetical protein